MSTITTNNPIETALEVGSIGAARAQAIVAVFKPLYEQVTEALPALARISVTDATQVSAMKAAREGRLKLRAIRIDAEKHRKAFKEAARREGRSIDDVYKIIATLIDPEEARLEECEKFAERAEAERIREMVRVRTSELLAVGGNPALFNLDRMTDDEFADALSTAKRLHDEAKERARKQAEEAAAKAKADAEERERLRQENERLRAEQAERDRKAAQERAEADAKAKQEREAREKAERDAQALRDAEAKRIRDEAAAAARKAAEEERQRRIAAAAPDAEKIHAFARAIRAVPLPDLSDRTKAMRIEAERTYLAEWISDMAKAMTT